MGRSTGKDVFPSLQSCHLCHLLLWYNCSAKLPVPPHSSSYFSVCVLSLGFIVTGSRTELKKPLFLLSLGLYKSKWYLGSSSYSLFSGQPSWCFLSIKQLTFPCLKSSSFLGYCSLAPVFAFPAFGWAWSLWTELLHDHLNPVVFMIYGSGYFLRCPVWIFIFPFL